MSHVFVKVLEISFSASFLVLAVILARLLLKKAPKWVRLLLWALVAVRLVLPVAPESQASLMPDTNELTASLETRLDAPILAPSGDHTAEVVAPNPNGAAPDGAAPSIVDTAPAEAPGPSLLTVLAWVWVGGMAAMALATAISYLRLRRKVAAAVRLQGNVYQSEQVASPFILGLLRPRIYLPFSLEEASLSHVLAHEQAHLKRKDHLWKPLGFALLTLHWFNPFIWLGYILLCRDIELACDEKVIKGLDIQSRADYSQALLNSSISRRSIAACPLAFGEVGVKQRIKSVLSYKKPAFWLILVALIACIAVAVCFLTDPPQKASKANGESGLFLIEDSAENLVSIQLPGEEWMSDGQQALTHSFIRSQIEKDFGADLALQESAKDVASKDRSYTGCYLEAQSRVTYRSATLVSMVFEGMYNQKGTAHPTHFLWALNYNPETLETVRFDQYYQVDEALYSAFSEAAEKYILAEYGQWPQGWGGFAEEICSEEQFFAGLSENGDFHYYFTETGVVISFPVPYALGDHKEVLLRYSRLTLKAGQYAPFSSQEYEKVTPVGQVPEEFQSIVQNNLFHSTTAFGDRLLIAETTATNEKGRATGHRVRMMDIYGRNLATYACNTADSYHVSTLTATRDGGFLFVLGFTDYHIYEANSWASEEGYASRVIKCDASGNVQFDTALESVESSALKVCIEKNGRFYFFGTGETPETDKPGVNNYTDVYMAVLDSRGNVLKTGRIAGSDFDSLHFAEATGDEFLLSVSAQSDDGDFAGSTSGGYAAPWVFTVNDDLEISSRKMASGRSFSDYAVGIKDGQPVYLSDPIFDTFDAGTPTAFMDYGDFYLIVSEHITGEYENTPLFISSIWYYWETVYSAYDNSGKLIFRSSVDSSPDYDAHVKSLG